MVKKTTEISSPNVRTEIVFGQEDADLATAMGLNLAATAQVRTELAAQAYNMATRHMIEAGVLLASVKAEVEHAEFMAMLEERGMHKQRAYELMRGAALVARLPESQRAQILALPKSKVLAIANASPAVVEAMLEDGDADLDLVSVRDLRERIKALEADLANEQVRRETAETDAVGLRKKLEKTAERDDKVPVLVADMRAEIAAAVKKAELALLTLQEMGPELLALVGGPAHDWVDPTLRQAISGVGHLGLMADGLLGKLANTLTDGTGDVLPARAYLTRQEMLEAAQAWGRLVAEHDHERALREWERQQSRPRGRGRPGSAPEAPKGV